LPNRPIVPPAVDAGWPPEHTALIAFQFVLQCRGSDLELTDLEAAVANQAFGITEMLSTARAHGYQAWLQSCAWEHLVAVPFPALAELRDGSFLVLGAYAHDRVLLQDPARRDHASALTRDRFLSLWSGRMVLVTTEASGPGHE
jgi:subfamily B ATP-binding cassette protein HlyB/CyaB